MSIANGLDRDQTIVGDERRIRVFSLYLSGHRRSGQMRTTFLQSPPKTDQCKRETCFKSSSQISTGLNAITPHDESRRSLGAYERGRWLFCRRTISLILERLRLAFTANGNREIRVDVFLKKRVYRLYMKIVQNNSDL